MIDDVDVMFGYLSSAFTSSCIDKPNSHLQVRVNRERLMVPALNAIATLLHTLKQCLAAEPEVVAGPPGGASLTEQLLQVRHMASQYSSRWFIAWKM